MKRNMLFILISDEKQALVTSDIDRMFDSNMRLLGFIENYPDKTIIESIVKKLWKGGLI